MRGNVAKAEVEAEHRTRIAEQLATQAEVVAAELESRYSRRSISSWRQELRVTFFSFKVLPGVSRYLLDGRAHIHELFFIPLEW